MSAYAVATIAFFAAFGGVCLAAIALVIVLRAVARKLIVRDLDAGLPCAICKQKRHREPIDRALREFFSYLPAEQLRAFTDRMSRRHRKQFDVILQRIWRARPDDPATPPSTTSCSPPGKDCH